MVQVYVMDITDLQDPLENPQIIEELDDVRKEKIMRCKQAAARKQSMGAGMLLRHVLEVHRLITRGQDASDLIKIGTHGKPEVAGICFNLSHSENMVACAVSEKPVGCDVEKVKEMSCKVADRFLNENEKNYLAQFSGNAKDKEFYRLWTMKESYMKMTGEGFSIPLKQMELCVKEDIKIYRGGETQNCFFKEYDLDGYVLTVCAMEETFSENLNIVMTK